MRNYELVLVLKPELTDETQEGFVQKVARWVTDKGGSISQTDKWGRKKLAYPLKQFMEGIYVLTKFSAEPALVRDVEKNLRLSEEVLRHLVVKLED
jgi:small subunit ribosomal protein S6